MIGFDFLKLPAFIQKEILIHTSETEIYAFSKMPELKHLFSYPHVEDLYNKIIVQQYSLKISSFKPKKMKWEMFYYELNNLHDYNDEDQIFEDLRENFTQYVSDYCSDYYCEKNFENLKILYESDTYYTPTKKDLYEALMHLNIETLEYFYNNNIELGINWSNKNHREGIICDLLDANSLCGIEWLISKKYLTDIMEIYTLAVGSCEDFILYFLEIHNIKPKKEDLEIFTLQCQCAVLDFVYKKYGMLPKIKSITFELISRDHFYITNILEWLFQKSRV